jgi:cytosine/adenosine deaminase-related metal-dependent hydrolase
MTVRDDDQPTLLLRNATCVATFDDRGREWTDASVRVRGRVIEAVGPAADLAGDADQVIDCTGCVVIPGLVNTHHHFFQSLTRAVPAGQDAELFDWLTTHYPVWAGITPEMIRVSTMTAMAELVLSGCTTASDHLYLYPNGSRLDDSIEAAWQTGLRFHASRGAMSVGQSAGGLPPDILCEREPAVLVDCERLIDAWHDPQPLAMQRIVLAPCSPFSVSEGLMRDTAMLARARGVRLHTHLAENQRDIDYTREHFGCTPAEYCERLDWLGPDVWHAHCVKLDPAGIAAFAATGTGVAHCPSSNMRLASGVAPIRAMLDAGVPVSIAVDGSASSDAGHLLAEARQALLLARVSGDPAGLSAREVLRCATRGGAQVLGRDDIGSIAPGMAADMAIFDLNEIGFAGAGHDPLAALLFCAPTSVRHSVINGRLVVRDRVLQTFDLDRHLAVHRDLSRRLLAGSPLAPALSRA